jgi:hypothetical protein
MAVVDARSGAAGTKLPFGAGGQGFVLRRKLDFLTTPCSSGDVIQALNIPANTFVLMAGINVTVAEGATAAGTLGDCNEAGVAVDVDGYMSDVDLNAVAAETSHEKEDVAYNDFDGGSEGKFYAAAGVIALVPGADLDAAKCEVAALCFPMFSV